MLQIGTTQQCSPDSSGNLPSTDFRTDDYTTFSSATLDPRSIHGIYNDFMVRYAFQHAKSGLPIQANAACPNNAYCTYSNIAIPHTTAECTAGSLDTPIVDIHANNVTTLRQYWAKDISNVFTTFIDDAPRVFYEGSMAGRTFYDLKNLTLTRLQNNTYNPAIRNMFGDQKFVFATFNNSMRSPSYESDKNIIPDIQVCTLRSFLNISTWMAYGSLFMQVGVETSTPVTIEYDKIGSNTFIYDQLHSTNVFNLLSYKQYFQ